MIIRFYGDLDVLVLPGHGREHDGQERSDEDQLERGDEMLAHSAADSPFPRTLARAERIESCSSSASCSNRVANSFGSTLRRERERPAR